MQFVHVRGTAQLLNPRNQTAHSLISFSPTNFFLTQHPPRSQLHEVRKDVIKRNVMQSNAATVGFLSLIAQAVCTGVKYHCVSFKIQKYPEEHFLWHLGCLGTQFGNQGTKEPVRHYSGSNQRAAEFSPEKGSHLYPHSQFYYSALHGKSSWYLSILDHGYLRNINKK